MATGTLLVSGAGVASVACLGAALLVLRGGSLARRLEARMRVVTGGGAATGVVAVPRALDIRRSSGGTPFSRALERIGRSPHVPADRRLYWPLILAAGIVAASAAAYLADNVIGLNASPVAALAAGGFMVRFMFRWELLRWRQQIFLQIPEALGLILRAVRAGLPMGEALSNVARELASPSREEFVRVVSEISIGKPVEAALFGLAERTGLTEYYFFAVTVGLQAQTGGSLGETLENLAEMVRKRVSLAARMKAMTAEARMSASIMTLLPFAVGGIIAAMNPGHMSPLFTTDFGFNMLMVGGGLLLTGLLIIRGLLRSAMRD
jgi:tight adherence protein B